MYVVQEQMIAGNGMRRIGNDDLVKIDQPSSLLCGNVSARLDDLGHGAQRADVFVAGARATGEPVQIARDQTCQERQSNAAWRLVWM